MNFKKKIFSFMIPSVQYDAHDGRTSGQKYSGGGYPVTFSAPIDKGAVKLVLI